MANLKIRFINFARSEALEEYTEKHIHSLLNRLERREGTMKSIEVQFKMDARAPFGQVKNSEVMIAYRYPGIKEILHIKKQGADLRKVLVEAIHAAETLIQKKTERRESNRRKTVKREIRLEQEQQ